MTEHVEQPMPTVNDSVSIQSLVRADLDAREQVGIQRYGTPLQPDNGRDAMRDLYEELLDACCYIKQAIVERDQRCEQRSPSGSLRCMLGSGHSAMHAYHSGGTKGAVVVNEIDLLRAATSPCTPLVQACSPPRLAVEVMGQEIRLAPGHVSWVRADMIVLRGNLVHVRTGPPEETWINALRRWSEWPPLIGSLVGTSFLACVQVPQWATVITPANIFLPLMCKEEGA